MDIYDKYIRTINDFPIKGIKFRDITPLLSNGDSFHQAIMDLNKQLPTYDKWDKIICAESRGFLFGAPLASFNSKGIVIARKPNKLPLVGLKESYDLEYGKATIEIPLGSIEKGERVIILDDLIATGGSALAMKKLVEKAGGIPILGLFLIDNHIIIVLKTNELELNFSLFKKIDESISLKIIENLSYPQKIIDKLSLYKEKYNNVLYDIKEN